MIKIVTSSGTMITTFHFENTQDLYQFLCYHSVFGNWEAQIARLSAAGGMTMDLTTKKINYRGSTTYLTFNNLKSLITNFFNNNSYMSISLDIKLKYPDVQRHIMDIYDMYSAFWLNCYSNPSNSTAYAAISFLENTKELTVDPIASWATYIHSLYDDYQIYKQTHL